MRQREDAGHENRATGEASQVQGLRCHVQDDGRATEADQSEVGFAKFAQRNRLQSNVLRKRVVKFSFPNWENVKNEGSMEKLIKELAITALQAPDDRVVLQSGRRGDRDDLGRLQ